MKLKMVLGAAISLLAYVELLLVTSPFLHMDWGTITITPLYISDHMIED